MGLTKSRTYQRLPDYLKTFVVEQNYAKYTPREQATWRFIMRQAREFFKEHAHPVYLEGLKKTGIPISRIPNIEQMDEVLGQFGWGAVCVCGFIPPLAFLDFQARKVLPIAADMRTLEHMTYTPAPDIVHEAAGHAPIIAEPGFADYLTRYAHLARKAIFSDEDLRLYEAIRLLSDVKANPDSTASEIEKAEDELATASANVTWVSEAAKVARMNWWTAEYGLVGSLERPKIFGAGLLSSLGESRDCLSPRVKKIPLDLRCTEQSYDITRPQPQLFVAASFAELTTVLHKLEKTMAFARGGVASMELARHAKTVTTTVLDSGLEISGVLADYEASGDAPVFIRWQGPVQLCVHGKELAGHGRARHGEGFSTPLGRWQACPKIDPQTLSDAELKKIGLVPGAAGKLSFTGGHEVEGRLVSFTRVEGRLLLLTWGDCTVHHGDKVLFRPEWGEFDMAVGLSVPSVFGGPADWEAYGVYDLGQASSTPARATPYTSEERRLFEMYAQLRAMREGQAEAEMGEVQRIAEAYLRDFPREWLLAVELIELLTQYFNLTWENLPWGQRLKLAVLKPGAFEASTHRFIELGLELAAVRD